MGERKYRLIEDHINSLKNYRIKIDKQKLWKTKIVNLPIDTF